MGQGETLLSCLDFYLPILVLLGVNGDMQYGVEALLCLEVLEVAFEYKSVFLLLEQIYDFCQLGLLPFFAVLNGLNEGILCLEEVAHLEVALVDPVVSFGIGSVLIEH